MKDNDEILTWRGVLQLAQNGNPAPPRRMEIMAAGMHHAIIDRGPRQAGLLLQGQGVHVAAQHERFSGLRALEHPDDAGARAPPDPEAAVRKPPLDDVCGAEFAKAQFGVGVDVPPEPDGFRAKRFDFFSDVDIHGITAFRH